jgi:hypothetical protein
MAQKYVRNAIECLNLSENGLEKSIRFLWGQFILHLRAYCESV